MTMFAFALRIISQDRIQTSLSTALLSPTKLGLSNLLRHSKLFFSAVFVDADEVYYEWAVSSVNETTIVHQADVLMLRNIRHENHDRAWITDHALRLDWTSSQNFVEIICNNNN